MRRRSLAQDAKCLVCIVALAAIAATMQALPQAAEFAVARAKALQPQRAHFGKLTATLAARGVADWVVRSRDSQGLPFLIIDKAAATIFVFDAAGRAYATAPVLLGIASGDRFEPGSAGKNMYHTRPEERITPAGRFQAELGIGDKGEEVVWIHYDAGIALHPVLDNPGERRIERLASRTPEDNRISYGCVNVPAQFYESVVRPIFKHTTAIVYLLPETQPAMQLFTASKPSLAGDAPGAAVE